jgi:hypothetical protein
MTEQEIDSLINIVIQDVAELPDRTSPEYWPDAMIVTGDELEEILTNRLKSGWFSMVKCDMCGSVDYIL